MIKNFGELAINTLLNLLKNELGNKVDKVSGKSLSTEDYTTSEKEKLAGIASGANKYTHPSYTSRTSGLYKITVNGSGHVSDATAVTKSDITDLGIPAQDTVYNHPSHTAKSSGLYKVTVDSQGHVSAATAVKKSDITGLGIPSQDTVYTHPSHTAKSSGLYKVTVDELGHVSTATAVTKSDITGLGIPAQDTVYSLPTASSTTLGGVKTTSTVTSTSGLTACPIISGVPYYKNTDTKYTHPAYTAQSSGLYKITVDDKGHVSAVSAVAKSDITGLGIPGQDTVYEHPAYTARTGKPTGNQTPGFGSTFTISQVTSDATGHVTGMTDRTVTIPSTEATTSAAGLMSSTDKTKLSGIESGAQKNTITGIKGNAESSYRTGNVNITPANIGAIPASSKGAASGVAELDANGKVPSSQLPSYVDDTIEGYYYNSKFYKESAHTTQITGESGKIYVDISSNKTYRWSGSAYVEISASLALGETSSTAYRGDRGKTAYDHSQSAHARTDATKVESSTTNGNVKIDGTETTVYTHPTQTSRTSGLYKITVNGTGHVTGATAVSKSDITGLGIPAQDTVYTHPTYTAQTGKPTGNQTPGFGSTFTISQVVSDGTGHVTSVTDRTVKIPNTAASKSAAGLMSAADKAKLDGIDTGANKITVDSALSSTSTNPVQNKVINTALAGKVSTSAFAMANVQLSAASSSVSIPSAITSTSRMLVFHNGLLLAKDIHYTVGTSAITLVDYSAESGDIFVFVSM